eukprot:2540747-Rhodomonas_salina.2
MKGQTPLADLPLAGGERRPGPDALDSHVTDIPVDLGTSPPIGIPRIATPSQIGRSVHSFMTAAHTCAVAPSRAESLRPSSISAYGS